MDGEAYLVLDALERGAHAELAGREQWIQAFKTIRWVVEGRAGPMLTPEGRAARAQLAREKPRERRPRVRTAS
jgi:hypothetical protein